MFRDLYKLETTLESILRRAKDIESLKIFLFANLKYLSLLLVRTQLIVRQIEFNFIRRKIERGRRLLEDYDDSTSEEEDKMDSDTVLSLRTPKSSSCIEPYVS